MNRYWIFQSRPDRYDLRQELYPGKIDSWDATRYRNFMEPGGIVFFRLSGEPEHRGISGRPSAHEQSPQIRGVVAKAAQKERSLAIQHLTEARRILSQIRANSCPRAGRRGAR